MKEEKVMYVILPKDAEYRTAYVTNDGKIAIVYAEETSKILPKPAALIGGTEVYNKEGLPYWFCKIKDGRDEFMHIYFGDLHEDDLLYIADGKNRNFETERQKEFREDVLKALKNKPKEGFRWIPVYEPSKDVDGNLQYIAGKEVLRNISSYSWERKFQNYSPENGSQMSSITTYFLLLLRFLKDGFATIEQLADDSKEIGHYYDSIDAKHEYEKTGERQLGGIYGFGGNIFKIVKDSESESGFSILGGDCYNYGRKYPLADGEEDDYPYDIKSDRIGLLELIK